MDDENDEWHKSSESDWRGHLYDCPATVATVCLCKCECECVCVHRSTALLTLATGVDGCVTANEKHLAGLKKKARERERERSV